MILVVIILFLFWKIIKDVYKSMEMHLAFVISLPAYKMKPGDKAYKGIVIQN